MYIKLVVSSLIRRKARMIVALLAVAIGATIMSGLVTIYYDIPRQLGKEFNVDILFVEKKKAFLEIFSRDLNVVGIFNKKVINGILSKVEVTTGEST